MRRQTIRNGMGIVALVVALAATSPARASYTVLTSVDAVSAPGVIVNLPTSGSLAIDSGSVSYGHGGTEVTLPSGVSIYLINTYGVLNPGPFPGNPSELVYVVAPSSAVDSSTISFSIGYGINGSTDSFVQSGSVTLNVLGGVGSFQVSTGTSSFATYQSGGLIFTGSGYSRNGSVDSLSNGASGMNLIVTPSSVPEPASIAMLGLGLVGFVGASAYRRRFSR